MAQLLIPHAVDERVRTRPGAVVQMVSPAPRDIWRGVLRDDPGATALQTPEYLAAVLTATRGRDASRVYQLSDGRQLVLPLVQERSMAGLRVESAYPGGYGHGGCWRPAACSTTTSGWWSGTCAARRSASGSAAPTTPRTPGRPDCCPEWWTRGDAST